MITVNFYFFFVGNVFCSLGFCFMISVASIFANIWFPRNEIFLVSSTCVFGLFTSDAIGTILIISRCFLWEGIALISIHLLMVIFFKGRPKYIQNYASLSQRKSFKQDLIDFLNSKNYLILLLSMSFFFANFQLSFVFMLWISQCYGYQSQANGIIIVIVIIFGCIGCFVIGYYAKNISYTKKTLGFSIRLLIAEILLWISLQLQCLPFSYICGALMGFCAYPLLSTLTDFATQITFPIGQATAQGILILFILFSYIFRTTHFK